MICGYCGTELPATALFCGECGRSLAASTGRTAPIAVPIAREPVAFASPASDTTILDVSEIDGATVMTRSRPAPAVEPVEPAETPQPAPTPVPEPVETPEPAPAPPVEPPEPQPAPVIEPVEPPETVREPEPEPRPQPAPAPEPDPWKAPAAASAPLTVTNPPQPPAADPWSPPARLLRASPMPVVEADLESTRIVSNTLTGQRFVLQFSTGESVTVVGTGLVGRNPMKEPAEYFDHLVTIVDPGKSVSKTHLEFGQVGTSFWVSDRFSGNGTTIREPDGEPRRCEPGRRYRIARGTRVTIGEQFFVVS